MIDSAALVARWQTLRLEDQLGNIGAELARARNCFQKNDREHFIHCLDRVHQLLGATIGDQRWRHRRKELTRLREIVNDWYQAQQTYDVSLNWLVEYCTQFAILSRT